MKFTQGRLLAWLAHSRIPGALRRCLPDGFGPLHTVRHP